MFKRSVLIFSVIIAVCVTLITGCSPKDAKGTTAKSTTVSGKTADESIVMPGDTYVIPAREMTFYCMRVNDEYYKFMLTGSSAELLSADDPSLFPVLEDGRFARVTADIEETINDFGYIPIITTISTRIVKLKSSEPVEFEDVLGVFNLPHADDENINPESKLFQYSHDGKLYLILRYKGRVTAYTKAGQVTDYRYEKGEDCFKKFFAAL